MTSILSSLPPSLPSLPFLILVNLHRKSATAGTRSGSSPGEESCSDGEDSKPGTLCGVSPSHYDVIKEGTFPLHKS